MDKIKILTNGPTLELFSKFIEKLAPLIKVTINDILIAFNLKEDKYPMNLVNSALKYGSMSDEEKELLVMSDEEIFLFNDILAEKRTQLNLLFESPILLFNALISQGIVNNEPIGLFDEFLDMLICSSYPKVDKSRLFMSSAEIWMELFVRLFLKQQGAIGKSFFIRKGIEFLKTNTPILSFMKKESLNTLKKLSTF